MEVMMTYGTNNLIDYRGSKGRNEYERKKIIKPLKKNNKINKREKKKKKRGGE